MAGNSIHGLDLVSSRFGNEYLQARLQRFDDGPPLATCAGPNRSNECVEVRCHHRRVLRTLIDAAKRHRVFPSRRHPKCSHFRIGHPAALQGQALHRIRGKALEISRLYRAKVTLGLNMQTNGLGHILAEPGLKPICTDDFVMIVDTLCSGVFSETVNHVADVVQQRSDHQRIAQPCGACELRRL